MRHGVLRILEKARVREARPNNVFGFSLLPVNLESHHCRRPHLDRRAAALRIALRVVPVAHRIERAVHRHRHEELRALRQLLYIRVAAVFPRRNRAQPLLRHLPSRRHRRGLGRRKHPPAARQQFHFPVVPLFQLLVRRRQPRRPHERAVRNAHPGQLRRGRVPGRDVPVRDEVVVEEVRQETAARREARPAVALGSDVEVLDLQQITRLRPLHVHRPRERMRHRALEFFQIFCGGF